MPSNIQTAATKAAKYYKSVESSNKMALDRVLYSQAPFLVPAS